MTGFKSELGSVRSRLTELESEARKLSNQNLADQIGLALGRLSMAMDHPDAELVGQEAPQAAVPNWGPADADPPASDTEGP